jgi:tetratricopeptide (TPR) repeat protein
MGIVYANMGQNQAAVESLLKAIKLDDPEGAAYYNLGLVLQRDNQYEAAIYCYNKALQLNPDRRDAQLNRAQIYEMLGGLDESEIMANPSVESLIFPID